MEEFFLVRLRRQFEDRDDVEIIRAELPGRIELDEPVDSAVAMNVLEHIEDDVTALRDIATVVRPGGTIVLWVPAYMQLYGDFDRKLGHVRRYTPETIRSAAGRAGLSVRFARPVNLLGGLAWWATVRRGGFDQPNRRLAAAYDAVVVPISRTIERVVRPPFGQSVICVADVPAERERTAP
jgi:SAM-dependent methyltransferase